ncbi:methylphosphotriester-DNA--protein-cysteine methyltransferase family protein|uniref:AraC family transcriptional regulator, regulatory protein of adaptative response / methylphosphotriester-DNA alkyltransferase methyltransferase n=1 Tax=Dendrosporobacter quercicolus TaxID=146817 RepID=A0A1G9NLE9_9FIRM|nr:Ada metal-binding domain-containing protein [Dendrosporobacter quercicolus]NSL47375.1 methylphosphotriester-DNA--protein-cysteine methyltransferase family protein [Dendrosporobacter quercicolus DSM 1736]SDL87184.1 AraC family transcriptional regulator, regulatory protein of adaptative response / methylphosphotriester-DNA alkyltransferase methyltransferase [Dendrosporobacter quercicolus]
MNKTVMSKEQWNAIKNGDKSYDGVFYYALTSTKTVCRPSCTARTPNPKNVEIFNTVEDAEKCGYRPCLRCRPNQMEWQGAKQELAMNIKNYIDSHYSEKFSSKSLGQIFYVNPFYLHRTFRDIIGMTIIEYQHQARMKQAMILLSGTNASISYIGYEVGYNTLSHFSRTFKRVVGVSPSEYRAEHHN